jgi:hypothetical protein
VARSYPLAVVLLVLYRVVSMLTMPIRQSFATSIVEPGEVAKAVRISSFARMGLRNVAPTVAGYMFEAISPSMLFLAGAFFVAANGLLYRVWFGPKTRSPAVVRSTVRPECVPERAGVGRQPET